MSGETLLELFTTYGYAIVFGAIVLENAGLPIPGELLLLTFGAISRSSGMDPLVGLLVAASAALVGDSAAYWGGRWGCSRFLPAASNGRRRFTPGPTTVVFGRFVVGARLFLAPLAGCRRMPYPRFLLFDAVGCLLWAGSFILVGYLAGGHVSELHGRVRAVLAAGIAGLGVTWLIIGLSLWRARYA